MVEPPSPELPEEGRELAQGARVEGGAGAGVRFRERAPQHVQVVEVSEQVLHFLEPGDEIDGVGHLVAHRLEQVAQPLGGDAAGVDPVDALRRLDALEIGGQLRRLQPREPREHRSEGQRGRGRGEGDFDHRETPAELAREPRPVPCHLPRGAALAAPVGLLRQGVGETVHGLLLLGIEPVRVGPHPGEHDLRVPRPTRAPLELPERPTLLVRHAAAKGLVVGADGAAQTPHRHAEVVQRFPVAPVRQAVRLLSHLVDLGERDAPYRLVDAPCQDVRR